jgi:hypothetical protein
VETGLHVGTAAGTWHFADEGKRKGASSMGTCFSTLNGGTETALTYSFLAIPEAIADDGCTTCIRGRVEEINRKGCYVQCIYTPPVDTVLQVAISDTYEDTFIATAKVLYVHDGVGMGIHFIHSAEGQEEKLNSWLLRDSRWDG